MSRLQRQITVVQSYSPGPQYDEWVSNTNSFDLISTCLESIYYSWKSTMHTSNKKRSNKNARIICFCYSVCWRTYYLYTFRIRMLDNVADQHLHIFKYIYNTFDKYFLQPKLVVQSDYMSVQHCWLHLKHWYFFSNAKRVVLS
jgi:hypothetical protein